MRGKLGFFVVLLQSFDQVLGVFKLLFKSRNLRSVV